MQIRQCLPPPTGGGEDHSTVARIRGLARAASPRTVGGFDACLHPPGRGKAKGGARDSAAIARGPLTEMWNLWRNLGGLARAPPLGQPSARRAAGAPAGHLAHSMMDSVEGVTDEQSGHSR